MEGPTRRSLLRRSGAALATALTGCLDRGDPGSPTTESPTSTDAPTTAPPDPSPTPADDPVAWTFETGGSIPTAAAVADGTAFVPSKDGTLYALDEVSGQEEWRYPIEGQFTGVSLVHDETVIAQSGTNSLGADQPLHALDAATGEERWTYSAGGWQEVVGVREDTLYVATSDDYLQPTGQELYAVSLANGTETWSSKTGDSAGGLVTDDAVYVPSNGRLYAFDAETGNQRWAVDFSRYSYRTIAAVANVVCYVAESDDQSGALHARDATTGEERWRFDDWFVSSTTTHDGTLYVGGKHIAAIDPGTGSPRWQTDPGGFVPRAPIRDGTLYAGGGAARAIAVVDGSIRWSWTPDVSVQGLVPANASHGAAHFDSFRDADPRNRFKFAVETDSGSNRWTFGPDTDLTDLAVGEGRIVVGGKNGVAYGLDP